MPITREEISQWVRRLSAEAVAVKRYHITPTELTFYLTSLNGDDQRLVLDYLQEWFKQPHQSFGTPEGNVYLDLLGQTTVTPEQLAAFDDRNGRLFRESGAAWLRYHTSVMTRIHPGFSGDPNSVPEARLFDMHRRASIESLYHEFLPWADWEAFDQRANDQRERDLEELERRAVCSRERAVRALLQYGSVDRAVRELDLQTVMSQTGSTREQANEALDRHGNLVDAILALTP